MTLLLRETYLNDTKGYQFGRSDWFETWTEDRGKLFRSLQREYGRCVSKVYVDIKAQQEARPVGWVFSKKMRYEDARRGDNGRYSDKDYYVREVWVELRDTPLCLRCGKDETNHHEFVRDELNEEAPE